MDLAKHEVQTEKHKRPADTKPLMLLGSADCICFCYNVSVSCLRLAWDLAVTVKGSGRRDRGGP
jgi:hypothetical protein